MNYVWTWTKRNPNLTSLVRKSHIFRDAKAYALYHVYSEYQQGVTLVYL